MPEVDPRVAVEPGAGEVQRSLDLGPGEINITCQRRRLVEQQAAADPDAGGSKRRPAGSAKRGGW
jgi:hypothetical protein